MFYVHTLGCQMNVHDSERIAGCVFMFGSMGLTSRSPVQEAIPRSERETAAAESRFFIFLFMMLLSLMRV